jgi:hypothetical protein
MLLGLSLLLVLIFVVFIFVVSHYLNMKYWDHDIDILCMFIWAVFLFGIFPVRYFNFFFFETVFLVTLLVSAILAALTADGKWIGRIGLLIGTAFLFSKITYSNILDLPDYLTKNYSYNEGKGYFAEKSVSKGTATVLEVNRIQHNLNYYSCDITKGDNYKKFRV